MVGEGGGRINVERKESGQEQGHEAEQDVFSQLSIHAHADRRSALERLPKTGCDRVYCKREWSACVKWVLSTNGQVRSGMQLKSGGQVSSQNGVAMPRNHARAAECRL